MIIREIKDLYRFFKKQSPENRAVVFYAERRSDSAYVENLIRQLSQFNWSVLLYNV